MRRIFTVLSFLVLSYSCDLYAQDQNITEVYMLTCGPGNETYSRWGHSALRIVDPAAGTDRAYNWGVFDFSTPAFAWKFARGRLEYMLGVTTYDRFIQEYFMEGRWVQSQKINLEPQEISQLLNLIDENLKPENVRYRYDFFYDDCSTRIRDLLEKSVGSSFTYPPDVKESMPTFRFMIGKYLGQAPWLKFGIDLLMGLPGNKKASFRDKMFLPLDMKEGLSDVVINRNSKMIPLLQNPETILESTAPAPKQKFFTSPISVFSIILIIIILLSALIREKKLNRAFDVVLFSIFSILALMMIFFNFFTDHQQMRSNLNIIWLSPFIIMCLLSVIMNKNWHTWFRIVFALCMVSFLILLIFPNSSNNAFIPLMLILIVRCSARSGFTWNPLSVTEKD